MTTAHVEKFVELIVTDSVLRSRLGRAIDDASTATYITNSVKEAKALGMILTSEEVGAWLKKEQSRVVQNDGELSDSQLAVVAGGVGAVLGADPVKCCGGGSCKQPTNCQAASSRPLSKTGKLI